MNNQNGTRSRWRSACRQQPLVQLLREELDEAKIETVASHLDQCESCQQRLTNLAAGSSWWVDASRWLEPYSDGLDPCVDDLVPSEFDEEPLPSNAKYLLESGLLKPSDQEGMIGVLGRYQIRRIIGSGGTGIVLQGMDGELNRVVAIKVLAPWLAAHGPARRRFAREGQAVAAVVHENVVAIHHVEANGPVPFLVMQYIDGDSLQDYVVRNGPLDVPTALRITAQVAAALSAAHEQGLVHRDVKPANILVAAGGQRVWITDFGLARAVDDASLTRTGFIAGTPHYMSPEQARGETVHTGSDLFGMGSVLYFMLTGRPPFRAERSLAILHRICNEAHRPVREVNPEVPPEVAALLDRLLEKDVAKRYSKGEEVRSECLRLLSMREASFEKFALPIKPGRFRKRFPKIVLASMILLAGLVGNFAVWGKAWGGGSFFSAESRSMRDGPSPIRTIEGQEGRNISSNSSGLIGKVVGPRVVGARVPKQQSIEPNNLSPQTNSTASGNGLERFGNRQQQGQVLPGTPIENATPPQNPEGIPFVEQTEAGRWLLEFDQLQRDIDGIGGSIVKGYSMSDQGISIETSQDLFLVELMEFNRILEPMDSTIRPYLGDLQ